MHQNFQTGRRPVARGSTRGGGDAPAGLWALCPGRSRSWSRRAVPGSPSLQTARSPSVPSYTAALSALTAPSPSNCLPTGRVRLPLAPKRRQPSPY